MELVDHEYYISEQPKVASQAVLFQRAGEVVVNNEGFIASPRRKEVATQQSMEILASYETKDEAIIE